MLSSVFSVGWPLGRLTWVFLPLLSSAVCHASQPAALPMPTTAEERRELLGSAEHEGRELEHARRELRRRSEQLEQVIVRRGRFYFRLARLGILPLSGGFDQVMDHAARLERTRQALARDLAEQQTLAKQRIELARRLEELRARRGQLEREAAALGRARDAILAAQEREEAFRRAFQNTTWSPSDHAAVYGSSLGPIDRELERAGFLAMRGRLPFPVAGRAELRPVGRNDGRGPGIEMLTLGRSAVLSVFAGRVAFADEYPGYGNAVIVDHGAGYYTVSAKLDAIDVEVGQDVPAGHRLGALADDAAAELYFEIRKGSEALPAAEWFGI